MLVLLLACQDPDYAIEERPQDQAVPAPVIRLEPADVDFGDVAEGEQTTASFAIHNDGDAVLQVGDIRLDASAEFTVLTVPPLSVAPGESAPVELRFAPTSNRHAGTVWVDSDDPVLPAAALEIRGAGLFPALGVTPEPYLFGDYTPGCPKDGTLDLTNIGGAELVIDGIALVGDAFSLPAPLELPLSLAPRETRALAVRFTPLDEDDYEADLYITSNDPARVRIASLTGHGADGPEEYVDTFRQPDGPWDRMDVVFYVDQSCSMEDDQRNLRDNFSTFTTNLEGFLTDYQIMAVTETDGCHNGAIIDLWTEDKAGEFSAAVEGTDSALTEAGLLLTDQALAASVTGGCNEGFLREDAKTLLVMVSDEPDQSPSGWSHYFASYRERSASASVVAIVGDYPSGCSTAAFGAGYYEAAMASGGTSLSVCATDWGGYFQDIAQLAVEEPSDTFVLSWLPLVTSIEVEVAGEPNLAWTWDAAQNAVVFDDTPAPLSWIEISYSVAVDCG